MHVLSVNELKTNSNVTQNNVHNYLYYKLFTINYLLFTIYYLLFTIYYKLKSKIRR